MTKTESKTQNWLRSGWDHVWLPYTQMQIADLPLPVSSAKGSTITLADGSKLIDGTASWWSAAHGYSHPHIVQEMKKQIDKVSHVMFAGLANEPAYILAERLCHIAPDISSDLNDSMQKRMQRVFFSDSGSTAVEVSLKMALQYWINNGKSRKDRFICLKHGYHGDTMGAMSVSDPARSMHKAFRNVLPKHYAIEIPSGEYEFAELDETLGAISPQVAAFIMEPLVQGAGGLKFHSPDTLAEIRRLCAKHNILFIADEIATGFYRTGNRFACEEANIIPDIMCIGKGLTGGAITLGATLVMGEIYEAFLGNDMSKVLMHGPTYMGNPLACAAANASLDLFEQGTYLNDVMKIETQLYSELTPLREMAGVIDVRIRGAIGVVQLAREYIDIANLRKEFIRRGTWIRAFEDVIYIMPPLVITKAELSKLTGAVNEVVREWSKNLRDSLSHLFD